MDSEDARAVAELVRSPLSGFAAARSSLVRVLREQGRRDLAKRVAALRKPSVVLWALNQAGEVAASDLEALRSAGDRLRHAQECLLKGEGSAANQMSEASHEQRKTIDALRRRLGIVLTAAGHAASDETLRRVGDDLRNASVADHETWAALQEGRLLSEPEPVTLTMLDTSGMKRVSEVHVDHKAEALRKRVAAAEADVRRAEDLERNAQEQEEAARRRREQATAVLKDARSALSRLQRER